MQIFVRVDSGTNMGTGHVIRCITLAMQLRKMKFKVEFITKKLDGNVSELIKKNGFKAHYLERRITTKKSTNADSKQTINVIRKNSKIPPILIIDHYKLDIRWERELRKFVKKIIVIDDLADRKHDCDLLIDQNFYDNLENRYNKLVAKKAVKLLGPKYAMLRNEFLVFRKKVQVRKEFKKLLISFGGTDPTNETKKVVSSIKILKNKRLKKVYVVMGGTNKNKIKKLCDSIPNVILHYNVKNIAKLMHKSDFAIGAGGSTIWERMCLGLPTYVSTVATHQEETTNALGREKYLINIGRARSISQKKYAEILDNMNEKELKKVSLNSQKMVDGKGTVRVANNIKKIIK